MATERSDRVKGQKSRVGITRPAQPCHVTVSSRFLCMFVRPRYVHVSICRSVCRYIDMLFYVRPIGVVMEAKEFDSRPYYLRKRLQEIIKQSFILDLYSTPNPDKPIKNFKNHFTLKESRKLSSRCRFYTLVDLEHKFLLDLLLYLSHLSIFLSAYLSVSLFNLFRLCCEENELCSLQILKITLEMLRCSCCTKRHSSSE